MTKNLVNTATVSGFGDVLICEPELVERVMLPGEPMEGMKAFIKKRKPNFTRK